MNKEKWLDFQGQVVAITGGRRGIGMELAVAFAEAGAKVAVASKSADSGLLGEIFTKNNWANKFCLTIYRSLVISGSCFNQEQGIHLLHNRTQKIFSLRISSECI